MRLKHNGAFGLLTAALLVVGYGVYRTNKPDAAAVTRSKGAMTSIQDRTYVREFPTAAPPRSRYCFERCGHSGSGVLV